MSKSRKRKEPNYGVLRQEMAMLSDATPAQQHKIIEGMTVERLACLDAEFEHWAHKNQLPPDGEGWRTWLMMAGRGFGKTRAGAEWIYRLGNNRPGSRIALVGATIAEARSIMVEGVSGLLSVARRHRRNLKWEPSLNRLVWPNGSQAQLFSGDNADGLRGPEHHFAWVLTFEVEADEEPISISNFLKDVSDGLIQSDDGRPARGYAAYGRSMRDAVEPVVSTFAVDVFDDGDVLRSPPVTHTSLAGDEFGSASDDRAAERFHREQADARSLPASLRLTHYDPVRDYQTGEARSTFSGTGVDEQHDLPAVLAADEAKGLANAMLTRAWATRDRLTLRLPTGRMTFLPGTFVTLPLIPPRWKIHDVSIEAFVTIVELRPAVSAIDTLSADPGRVAANPDEEIGPITLALFDISDPAAVTNEPAILLAATSAGERWTARAVDLQIGSLSSVTTTARGKSHLGQALAPLPDGTPYLRDEESSVDIQLVDHEQWLLSCDDEALAAGANAAVLGRELIQFGRALPLGDGRFRLSRLLRGRGGTEWATKLHESGEPFCLLQPGTVQRVTLAPANLGATIDASPAEASASTSFAGESVRPLAPVRLEAEPQADGSLRLQWIRRSRAGIGWVDGVDAPLGETHEQYRIVVTSDIQSLELSTTEPSATIEAASMEALGSGPISISVQQVGDYAASRPIQIIIN